MPSPLRLAPLPLDVAAWPDPGLFSLIIELQPLRIADVVAALLLALCRSCSGLTATLSSRLCGCSGT